MKIKDLFHFEKGVLQSTKCTPGEFDFITASSDWKTHNEYTHECEALIFAAAASGSLGRTHYVNGKFISSDLCFILTPKDQKKYPIDLKFYHLIFQALKDEIVRNTKAGTSKEAIGLTAFGKYELPYFDVSKQIETKEKFVTAQESTSGLFIELTHQLNLVKQLRQAFLREAMQGKLTETWRTSHPELVSGPNSASQLLANIKAEKSKSDKKGKVLPPIKDDEIPFEIPEEWVWCRLGEISISISTGPFGTMLHKSDYIPNGIPLINPMNLVGGMIIPSEKMMVDEKTKNRLKSYVLKTGDIVIGRRGEMGRCAVVSEKEDGWLCGTGSFFLSLHYYINRTYFVKVLSTDFARKLLLGKSVGSTMNNLNHRILNNLTIPIPPIHEQQQIVSKLDELMYYCDQLEESIRASQQQNEQLLQQVLREALEPKIKYKSKVIDFKTRKCNSSEKAILAGHIINQTNSEDFGRVKFQKLLYLVEHHCKLDLSSNYQRKVAGPHDGELLSEIESTLELHRFYKIRQSNERNHRVSYTALSYASELEDLYKENFSSESSELDEFLSKFKNSTWEQCEIVATLYAVWNNRIIRKEQITDELLKQDFLNWDKKKIKYQDRLDGALEWMKRKIIIPDGWGKVIE